MIGTLAVDGWACYIWCSEEGPGRAAARPVPSSLYQMQQLIKGQCTNFILFDVALQVPLHCKRLMHYSDYIHRRGTKNANYVEETHHILYEDVSTQCAK